MFNCLRTHLKDNWFLYLLLMSALEALAFCGRQVVTLHHSDLQWKKTELINRWYDQKQCSKECGDPSPMCREYCYDTETGK